MYMRAKDAVGQYGEDVATQHLVDSGFVIIARNWRCAGGEVDIVAYDGPILVFCEVKTRSSIAFGAPAEAITAAKAARLRRLALLWLDQHRATLTCSSWPELRFDVVAVLRARSGAASVEHLQGAF